MARDAEREKCLRSLSPNERKDAFFAWPNVSRQTSLNAQDVEAVHMPEASTSASLDEEPPTKKRKIDPSDPWRLNEYSPGITERFPALTQRK